MDGNAVPPSRILETISEIVNSPDGLLTETRLSLSDSGFVTSVTLWNSFPDDR
jgi:hypothetical protein